MKLKLKAAIAAGAASLAVAGAGLVAFAIPASAATTGAVPPWDPDPNAVAPYNGIIFYDANGNPVTSGTNLDDPFAYAVAGSTATNLATQATQLNFYNPQPGVLTANFTGTTEGTDTTFSPTSSLPAGTPADLVTMAGANYPVDAAAADINTWISGNTASTTTGYANTIEVKLFNGGPGGHGSTSKYWETDIGYNTSGTAVTINEPSPGSGTVTIPAHSWIQIFPSFTSSTISLATSATAGHLLDTSDITLTATVPSADPGIVQFYDNGAFLADATQSGGTATFTSTSPPSDGAHAYTAEFVPYGGPPGDLTGGGTATENIIDGSASNTANVSVTPPQTGTSTTLSDSAASINFGGSETLTSTASATDSTNPAGTVEFLDGSTPIAGCTAVAINPPASAVCTTTALPQGSNSITAVFTPTSNSYATSTSAAVTVTVAAPAACTLTGSVCSDQQNITVTINPGTITITTPYTASNPFVLPAMTLSSDGTYFQSSAPFPATSLPGSQQIVVTSSIAPAYAWTLSVSATALSSSGGGTIPSSGLGLTGGNLLNASGPGAYLGTVTFTGIPALNPSPVDGTGTGPGLSSTPQTFATSTAADGTAEMDGTLTLDAATNTPAGTYTGTITFTVS